MTHNMREGLKLLAFFGVVAFLASLASIAPTIPYAEVISWVTMNLIYFAVILCFLVCIHEWGHYYFFKKPGAVVDEFSVGFGPRIASFHMKNGEKWSFACILAGGFVRPKDESMLTDWQRMKAIAAGPIVNILFGFVLLVAALMLPTSDNIEVMGVAEGSQAQIEGVEVGDTIVDINDIPVATAEDFHAAMAQVADEPTITVTFDGGMWETYDVELAVDAEGNFGLALAHTRSGGPGFGLVDATTESFSIVVNYVPNLVGAVSDMIASEFASDDPAPAEGEQAEAEEAPGFEMVGPNKFGEMLRTQVSQGLFTSLVLIATISLLLGYSNLIPLLPLDGGHMLATGAKMLKMPIPEKVQLIATKIVAYPLIVLTFVWLLWDIIELALPAVMGFFGGLF